MPSHIDQGYHLLEGNLPFTDTSRLRLRTGQYRIHRDNKFELGYEILYHLTSGILLRVLDLSIRSDLLVSTVKPGKQLGFAFKLAGNNVLEYQDGKITPINEGCMVVSYVNNNVMLNDRSQAGDNYLLVLLMCNPNILLQPPFNLEADQLPEVIQDVLQGADSVNTSCPMNAELIQALRSLLSSNTADQLNRPFIEAKSIEILCLALRNMLRQEGQQELVKISEREQQQVHLARDLLQQRIQNPPSLEELERILGLGKTRLKKSFKHLYGYSIKDYIVFIRMQRAQQLLSEVEMNVSQVAWEVGYEHSCNFGTAFKRQFGMTPKVFQKLSAGRRVLSPE